jgi:large subunit ribosomal protein L29
MKVDKIRELDTNELQNQLNGIPEQMFRLKFQLNMGQTDGVKKLRALRKDRARMLTVLRQRELNPEIAPAPKKGKK